jgi:putative zinc finger/helix-turn-helix YgiT family protein
MKCTKCDNKKSLSPHIINLKYKTCGLDNVTVHDVTQYRCDRCGEEYLKLGDEKKLHEGIAEQLLAKKDPLTGQEVRFLRKFLGYNIQMFARLTGYDPASLSRIEHEKQPITQPFNNYIRSLVAYKIPNCRKDLHELWISKTGLPLKRVDILPGGESWIGDK